MRPNALKKYRGSKQQTQSKHEDPKLHPPPFWGYLMSPGRNTPSGGKPLVVILGNCYVLCGSKPKYKTKQTILIEGTTTWHPGEASERHPKEKLIRRSQAYCFPRASAMNSITWVPAAQDPHKAPAIDIPTWPFVPAPD